MGDEGHVGGGPPVRDCSFVNSKISRREKWKKDVKHNVKSLANLVGWARKGLQGRSSHRSTAIWVANLSYWGGGMGTN